MLEMNGSTCLIIAQFFADNRGSKSAKKLKEKIEYLDRYGEDQGTKVQLHAYQPPYKEAQMDVTFKFRSGRVMYGGLVYHKEMETWGVHT